MQETETLTSKSPPAVQTATSSRRRQQRRKFVDVLAKRVFGAGGFAIVASILAILVFILLEILPLFRAAQVERLSQFELQQILPAPDNLAQVVAVGLDENQEIGYLVTEEGSILFYSPGDGKVNRRFALDLDGRKISSVAQSLKGTLLLVGTDDGRAYLVAIVFGSRFVAGARTYDPGLASVQSFEVDPAGQALIAIAFGGDGTDAVAIAAITADNRIQVIVRKQEESLFGDAEIDSTHTELQRIWRGRQVSIALSGSLDNLYTGSDDGKIYHWQINEEGEPAFVATARANAAGHAITKLNFLIGSRTLIVGDDAGGLGAWFLVRDQTSAYGWRLTRIRQMSANPAAVTALAVSARGKGFISGDAAGNLLLQYSTSGRLLARFAVEHRAGVRFINYAPKANAALVVDSQGRLSHWRIDSPHPEAGFNAFFGKVWYEGYEKPEYVWQSTGGSDEFEPKLSLVPLIFGSLKGTLYTLIISIPLAILAALYTSQFMHPTLKNKIKPAVEVMAALPSVVLGFLGGLWLAPRVELVVPALILMAFVLPTTVMLASFCWTRLPHRIRQRFRPGIESALLIPVLLLGAWLCIQLNTVVETTFFVQGFKTWLHESIGLHYDQRNALVVGIAMGFAVIPIIYTISEDALSNVPKSLVSGSLALGATPWQTAIRVVLPTAAAGIFSAIMIGLGRAVGETMIVLMATGNTPIMEWNIFNGFRTLAANIAVEVPEAPVGGTLYRVLFLAAMLLFVITFAVNTLAEVVRQHLRTKYQKL